MITLSSETGATIYYTLDGNRTVGAMTFGNANPINWTIAASNGAVLTLANGAASPVVTVASNTAGRERHRYRLPGAGSGRSAWWRRCSTAQTEPVACSGIVTARTAAAPSPPWRLTRAASWSR